MPGLLDVTDPRLPEDVQRIDLADCNIAQAAQFVFIPEHAINARALLQLLPQHVGIRLLKVVLLQNYRHNAAQPLGLLLVAHFPGPDVGFRERLDAIRVLGNDAVEQPCRRGPVVQLVAGLVEIIPVPQFPPLLAGNHPRVLPCLARPVALQYAPRLEQLLLPHMHLHRKAHGHRAPRPGRSQPVRQCRPFRPHSRDSHRVTCPRLRRLHCRLHLGRTVAYLHLRPHLHRQALHLRLIPVHWLSFCHVVTSRISCRRRCSTGQMASA